MGYSTYTCPIARSCGGCELLAVPYPIQLERKQAQVEGLFAQMADADGCTVEKIVGMEKPVAFRHKAATPFAPGTHGRIRSGFYTMGTHRIVACAKCLVEHPQLRPILNSVARCAERLGISAYREDQGRGLLRHAIARRALHGDDLLLTIVTNGDHMARRDAFLSELLEHHPEITSVVQNVNTRRTNAMLGDKCSTLYGPGIMHDSLLGCTFEIGATSFYQTNPAQTEVLYDIALRMADLKPGMRLLDAYCGTGTIGLCAAHMVPDLQVVGVERVKGAVTNARRNARANQLDDRARFVCADATEYLAGARGHGRELGHYDVVMLDPPRAGSTPEFLSAVSSVAPDRVVYISCNPETQARDIAFLRERGWKLRKVTPVDLFPHTKHIETVAMLSRSDK